MILTISLIVIGVIYIILNCAISKKMNVKEMKSKFVTGQNLVGKIATNIFYAPAWLLKCVKFLAVNLIK